MLISGIIIFFILDNESGEAIAAVLGVFGIIFLFLFAIIRDGNESLETNKKEFQRVIKEAKIKTTPEKNYIRSRQTKSILFLLLFRK